MGLLMEFKKINLEILMVKCLIHTIKVWIIKYLDN